MRPTPDDVLTALDLISSRVPDRHVTPDPGMAVGWLDDLVRYDRAAIFRAARTWGGLRFPAVNEFVAECQEAARAIALEEQAARSAGELPTAACRRGCSRGWLFGTEEFNGQTYKTTWPCEECAPVPFAVWQHRARAGHDPDRCPDCAAIRRGKDGLPEWLLEAREVQARRGRVEQRF